MPNPYPLYASDLTLWKCPRALYYHSTARDKRTPLDDVTKQRLNHFARLETMAIALLKDSGWNIIKPEHFMPGVIVSKDEQELFIYKDGEGNDIMRGRIDLIACPPGKEIGGLFEVKTVMESIFNKTDSITDLIDMPIWWSGQVAQWIMYMYMSGRDYGGIVQFCRETGAVKVHYGSILKGHEYYNQELSAFAETVIHNVDTAWIGAVTGIEPEFCEDLSVCSKCWCFGNVCHPPIKHEGVNANFLGYVSGDEVARMVEIEPFAKEYESLKRRIEEPLKQAVRDFHGAPDQGWLIGDGRFLAKAKVSERTNYKVPEEIKKQYAEKSVTISIRIESLEQGASHEET